MEQINDRAPEAPEAEQSTNVTENTPDTADEQNVQITLKVRTEDGSFVTKELSGSALILGLLNEEAGNIAVVIAGGSSTHAMVSILDGIEGRAYEAKPSAKAAREARKAGAGLGFDELLDEIVGKLGQKQPDNPVTERPGGAIN